MPQLSRRRGKASRRDSPTTTTTSDGIINDKIRKDDELILERLYAEMEQHMALDRIMEARRVVDEIQSFPRSPLRTRERQEKVNHIVQESNHITEMLRQLQTNDGWTFANERKGITVHYRHEEGSAVHTIKTHTILENYTATDFLYLISLLLEADLMWKWFPQKIVQSVEILAEPSKYHKILLAHLTLHLPMVADREMLAEGIGYHLGDQNAMLCYTKTIDSSRYCNLPPPKGNRVRMESQVIFFFQLLPGDRVRFCQISHDNLKIRFMPAFLLNFLAQGVIPMEFIHQFKKTVNHIKGTEWDRRVNVEKRELYKELEQRIHEELALLNSTASKGNGHTLIGKSQKSVHLLATQGRVVPMIPSATGRKQPGLPLWMSVCIAVAVGSTTRISSSVESLRLPWFVYPIILTFISLLLTHLTIVFERKRSTTTAATPPPPPPPPTARIVDR